MAPGQNKYQLRISTPVLHATWAEQVPTKDIYPSLPWRLGRVTTNKDIYTWHQGRTSTNKDICQAPHHGVNPCHGRLRDWSVASTCLTPSCLQRGRGRYTSCYTVTIRLTPAVGHFNVSLIVRDKVTRQCPQTQPFRREGRAEAESSQGLSLIHI